MAVRTGKPIHPVKPWFSPPSHPPKSPLNFLQAEHSLELHTPFISRVMAGRPFKLVPIMVGALTSERWV